MQVSVLQGVIMELRRQTYIVSVIGSVIFITIVIIFTELDPWRQRLLSMLNGLWPVEERPKPTGLRQM